MARNDKAVEEAIGLVVDARNHRARVISRADEEYREALEAFLAAGGSYVELGRLLGVSRQAVRQYVERGREAEMRAHLDNGGKWDERGRKS